MLLLGMATSTAVMANDGYDYLVFSQQDGTTQSVTAVGTIITFDGTNANVKNGTTVLTLPGEKLVSMFFSSDAGSTGIETVDTAAGTNSAVEVYTLGGVRVDSMQQGGVYIVKKNGKTYKQVVK